MRAPTAEIIHRVLREIHFRVLLAGHSAMLRRLTWPSRHESRIARAIAQIRRNLPAAVSDPELARVAGMSTSGFHAHLKAVTAMTPLQFRKNLQLLAAQRLLAGGTASVSAAAFAVGYESSSQFSREYARKLGHPPSTEPASR